VTRRGAFQLITLAIALAVPAVVSAELGGSESSIDTDRARLQAAQTGFTRLDSYAVHELRSAPGTTIREFVSSTGTVFAVSWRGPWMPDLQQLLGPYFQEYQQTVRQVRIARRGRGPLQIQTPTMVVGITGVPRAFSGTVLIPRLAPPGVDADTLK
jgi:hypothetical protein